MPETFHLANATQFQISSWKRQINAAWSSYHRTGAHLSVHKLFLAIFSMRSTLIHPFIRSLAWIIGWNSHWFVQWISISISQNLRKTGIQFNLDVFSFFWLFDKVSYDDWERFINENIPTPTKSTSIGHHEKMSCRQQNSIAHQVKKKTHNWKILKGKAENAS